MIKLLGWEEWCAFLIYVFEFVLVFLQGAARCLTTQRKNLEIAESVGAAGKAGPERVKKYFRLELIKK